MELMIVVAMVCARPCTVAKFGSLGPNEVTPESTNALAPASAAASAARCISLRATYKVTTSIANAAMASSDTRLTATSMIVWPRSPERRR